MSKSRKLQFALEYTGVCIALFLVALFAPFDSLGIRPTSTNGQMLTVLVALTVVVAMYWRHFISRRYA